MEALSHGACHLFSDALLQQKEGLYAAITQAGRIFPSVMPKGQHLNNLINSLPGLGKTSNHRGACHNAG